MLILRVMVMIHAALAQPWPMHIIDDGSRGADGVRLADFNGDGLLDIVTGWEEGGAIRLCLQPGPENVTSRWPVVVVGNVESPEDAVPVDLNGDGGIDIVSSCEGGTRSVYVHWNPGSPERLLDSAAWKTEPITALAGMAQWMFCSPMDVNGDERVDLVFGSKNENASIGWLESPENSMSLPSWRWRLLRPAGWIMSLISSDMDGDGDADILFSDRRGDRSGVYWLERPEISESATHWREHAIGGVGREVMFISEADVDRDGLRDVIGAVKPREILMWRRLDPTGQRWHESSAAMPKSAGTAKAVTAGELDGKGTNELVFTCEQAEAGSGVMGLQRIGGDWAAFDISGGLGIKFDLVELRDLDGDGDLDVLTCEEREIGAVIWYENPANTR